MNFDPKRQFRFGLAVFAIAALHSGSASAQACGRGPFNGSSLGFDAGLMRSNGDASYSAPVTAFPPPASVPFSSSDTGYGPLGGIRAGYDWQCGGTVYGVEADWSFVSLKNTATSSDPFQTVGFFINQLTTTTELHHMGTLRGRMGLASGQNWLVYGTAGVAFGQVKHDLTFRYPGVAPDTFSTSDKSFKAGWALGLGTEYALSQWSIRGEVLYIDLADTNLAFGLPAAFGTPMDQNAKWSNTFWVSRVGLTYRY